MKQQPSHSQTVTLIPAHIRPFQVKDITALIYRGMEEEIRQTGYADRFRCLELRDGNEETRLSSEFSWLTLEEVTQLAAGKNLRTPIGEIGAPGRLRMVSGHEDGKLVMVMLEFLPDEPVAQGMPFHSWYSMRLPADDSHLHESRNEAWWIHFHSLWAKETRPGPTLAPDDALLCSAVLNNHEHWLEAILRNQPRIEVRAGSEKTITETALGMAMENTGMFGAGPGFACGCHRLYRDDDFCESEDPETWVPRAERIAERLKAAGAIDYAPLLEACRDGRTDDVEAMLKAGFPPNFAIYGHTTALCEAVRKGHEEICDLLLCHGANPNLPRPFYTSMTHGGKIYPLTLTIDHPAILKRLLQAGADPNRYRDDCSETPVLFARRFETQEQADEVFEQVDFTSIQGMHGRSGVFYLEIRDLPFCRKWIPGELLNRYDQRGTTPLLHAVITEAVCKARLLVEMGADPNQPGMIWEDDADSVLNIDRLGIRTRTQYLYPIQAALQIGDLELVEFLLDHGAIPQRQSIGLNIPRLNEEVEYTQLRDRLLAAVKALDGDICLSPNKPSWCLSHPRAYHSEILLATLLINQPAATIQSHAEFIESIDLVSLGEAQGTHPAAIEPFRSGKKLGNVGWMALLDESIGRLKEATVCFAAALHPEHPDESNCADTSDLLAPLKHAEQTLIAATLRITGKHLKPLNLSAEVCDRASGDFQGGTARAYRAAETTGKVGFDDFIEALAEHFQSGSTMDHGKLLQAVQLVTKRLEKRCESLRKAI